jgi:hypothetical protein
MTGGAESAERKKELGRLESGGGDLQAQAQTWARPTPRAEDSESTGAHRGNLDTLNSAVQNFHPSAWQTPATDSFRSRGGDRKDEMGLDQQGRFWEPPSRLWGPPQTHDAHPGDASRIGRHGTKAGCRNLTDDVMVWEASGNSSAWPTPANRDHRDPNLLSYQERSDSTKGEQLNNFVAHVWRTPHGLQYRPEAGDPGGGGEFAEQATTWTPSGSALPVPTIRFGLTFSQRVRILLRLCRQLQKLLPKSYSKGRSIFRRKLNQDFGTWLMMWPDGWCNVDRVCSASEMELWRSRQRLYLEFLLGGLD